MNKRLGTLMAIALIATTLNIPANAATKAGSVCKSKGLVSNYQGKKFTCIKTGKKLLWDKGVVIAKPVVQVSPAALKIMRTILQVGKSGSNIQLVRSRVTAQAKY